MSGLTTLIGVALAFRLKDIDWGISLGIGFASGIMLIISIFELIPESFKLVGATHTLISILLGAILVGSLDYILPHIHISNNYDDEERRNLKSAYLITFGLILHDFPEGFKACITIYAGRFFILHRYFVHESFHQPDTKG